MAFTETTKHKIRSQFSDEGIYEVVILSTCNRSEIYVAHSDDVYAKKVLIESYKAIAGGADVEAYLYVKSGENALIHLYRVACGLDSLVLGEDQILGQLKCAKEEAAEFGCLGKHLGKVMREAITFSKKVRSTYRFSENQLSVAAIGVKYLRENIGHLRDKKNYVNWYRFYGSINP